jgi:hypothetical protein
MIRPADALSAITNSAPTKVSNNTPKRRFITLTLLYTARKKNTKAPPRRLTSTRFVQQV